MVEEEVEGLPVLQRVSENYNRLWQIDRRTEDADEDTSTRKCMAVRNSRRGEGTYAHDEGDGRRATSARSSTLGGLLSLEEKGDGGTIN